MSNFGNGGGRQVSSNYGQGLLGAQSAGAGVKRKGPDDIAPGISVASGAPEPPSSHRPFPAFGARPQPGTTPAAAPAEASTRALVPPPSSTTAPAPVTLPIAQPVPTSLVSLLAEPRPVNPPFGLAPVASLNKPTLQQPGKNNGRSPTSGTKPYAPVVSAKTPVSVTPAPVTPMPKALPNLLAAPVPPLPSSVPCAPTAATLPMAPIIAKPAPHLAALAAPIYSKPRAAQTTAPIPFVLPQVPSAPAPSSKPTLAALQNLGPAPTIPLPKAMSTGLPAAPQRLSVAPIPATVKIQPSPSPVFPSALAKPPLPAAPNSSVPFKPSVIQHSSVAPLPPPPISAASTPTAALLPPQAAPPKATLNSQTKNVTILQSQPTQSRLAQPLPMAAPAPAKPATATAVAMTRTSVPPITPKKTTAQIKPKQPLPGQLPKTPSNASVLYPPPAASQAAPQAVAAMADLSVLVPATVPNEDDELLPDAQMTLTEEIEYMRKDNRRLANDLLAQGTAAREKLDRLEHDNSVLSQQLQKRQAEEAARASEGELHNQLSCVKTELANAQAAVAEERAKAQVAIAAAAAAVPAAVPNKAGAVAAQLAKLQPLQAPSAPQSGRVPSLLGTQHLLKKLLFRSQPKYGLTLLFSASDAHKSQELQTAISAALNQDASPLVLLPPLYSFTEGDSPDTVENALALVLVLVQSSPEIRKAMLSGAPGVMADQVRVPVMSEEFSRLSLHPLVPRNPRIRLGCAPPVAPPVELPQPQPSPESVKASEILRSLLKRLPAIRDLSLAALELALCIISTVLDRCPLPTLRSLEEQINPLLRVEKDVVWIAETLRTSTSSSQSERIVSLTEGPSFFTASFHALLPRLVRLLHANATPATLPVRHRVVRLFRYCLDTYRDPLLAMLSLDRESELHFLDRLVVMLESELDQCCVNPGPAGRIPNSASRLFVAETCYLLWQCMSSVGRHALAHRMPLVAIGSRLVQGEVDPELRGLAAFGIFFVRFEFSDDSGPPAQELEEMQVDRERERSEGYSSPGRR